MAKLTKHFIQTSIVTGFTIAAALIWKDAVISAIEVFLPPKEEVLYKFLVAIISTILIISIIYIISKTETEAEFIIGKMHEKKKSKTQKNKSS
jgi:hypothetical protein